MARVIISTQLFKEISRKFGNKEANTIIDLLEAAGDNPNKGDVLGQVEGVVIKEIRYKTFRFYFITDGHILKFGSSDELAMLLIKFVKISKKNNQQKAIDGIKNVLKSLGFDGF